MLEKHIRYIKEHFPLETLGFNEPMSRYTSFNIGGPADVFYQPTDIEGIKRMVMYCKQEDIAYYIIGNGSNLLVGDKGYRGVIIQIYKNMNKVAIEEGKIQAQAGILLSRLARMIYEASLEGFEFASGIPGTLGGAVYMNAGAYGGEMKDILIDATVISRDGEIRTMSCEDLVLDYRHSVLMDRGDIVLSANIALEKGDQALIKSKMDDLNQRRKDKQPIEKPSAGSTFKRPTGYYAGKLIMDAGLRGCQIGGARVSDKHCGFIINAGDATGKDVLDLIKHIQKEVKKRFDVTLETEVRMIGEF